MCCPNIWMHEILCSFYRRAFGASPAASCRKKNILFYNDTLLHCSKRMDKKLSNKALLLLLVGKKRFYFLMIHYCTIPKEWTKNYPIHSYPLYRLVTVTHTPWGPHFGTLLSQCSNHRPCSWHPRPSVAVCVSRPDPG